MSKTLCPECGALVHINPGEQKTQFFTAQWWTTSRHLDPKLGKICLGSGRRL